MTQQSELPTLPPPIGGRRIRKRWGVLALLLILLLALIGLHWIWTVGAGRRLATQAARYRAAGQPIELADFATVGVVPGDNAVIDLRAAADAIDRTTEAFVAFRDQREEAAIPLRPEELQRMRALLAANPKALPLLESASRKPGVNWGLVFRTPVITIMLPDLTTQRDLARVAQADALVAHADGDHARAVQRVREMLFQTRAIGHQPIMVSNLVSIGIGVLAAETSQQMTEDLRVGAAAGDASPQQVRELIAELLDEKPVAEARRIALLGERMMQLDMARAIANGNVAPGGGAPAGGVTAASKLIKPTALDDGVIMTRHTTAVLEAVEKSPTWAMYQKIAPQLPADLRENSWRHVVANVYMPALDRFVLQHYRNQFERRSTALLLALRLYAVDHGGALPDTLDALVPKYLPFVPADPFAPMTQPLKYAGGADPIVYSVGENGVDDGGAEDAPTTAPSPLLTRPSRVATSKWEKLDIVTRYRRQPRPPPEPLGDGMGGFGVEPATAPAPTTEPVAGAP